MKTFNSSLYNILRQADVIVEETTDDTYLGFCEPGTELTSAANWSICQIKKTTKTTTIKWANGQQLNNLVMDNYLSYTYTFKKF
jgi:hypothetical protein